MKPQLVFVVQPWGVEVPDFYRVFKDLGYSVIALDELELSNSKIRELIIRRSSNGPVVVYGTPIPYNKVIELMGDDICLIWLYPNKQSEYYKQCQPVILAGNSVGLNEECKSVLERVGNDDKLRIDLVKKAHAYQKESLNAYLKENENLFVVLI